MSFLIVIGGLALVAFVLAYVRSGRFGPAALSLMAGYTLALFWADTIAVTYEGLGEGLGISPWRDAVYASFITLPALAVLLVSPKRKSIVPRIVGALAFAALAVVLLMPIFSSALFSGPSGNSLYATIDQNRELVMTVVLVLALIDVIFASTPKLPKRQKD